MKKKYFCFFLKKINLRKKKIISLLLNVKQFYESPQAESLLSKKNELKIYVKKYKFFLFFLPLLS
jgi:hypothetical protein